MLRRALIVVIASVAASLFSVGLAFGPDANNDPAGVIPAEALVSVVDTDGARKTLPLVDGGDSDNPVDGAEANADPRTPVVRVGQPTDTWTALDELLGDQQHYTDCVDATVGTTWETDVEKFKTTEEEGFETRFLLVVNSGGLTDETTRRRATEAGVEGADKLEILRAAEFINTRGFKDKEGCEEFLDRRPQIRESLGVVTYDKDGKPNGLKNDRGAFTDCHNPWQLAREVGPPTTIGESPSPEVPEESATPTPTPSTSTPPPHDECPNKPGNQPPGYACPKGPAPQPSGVEQPGRDNDPDPEPEPRPVQEDPLEPEPDPEPEPEPTRSSPPNEGGDNDGCVPNPGETTCP